MVMRMSSISQDIHVTRVAGHVQWEGSDSIAGLLIEYFPEAKTLVWAQDGSSDDDRKKWMAELRHTVGHLHDAQMVWGDVKPQNVLIDSHSRMGGRFRRSLIACIC